MDLQTLRRIILESEQIVFLGGAGISTESGIPDFRSHSVLYNPEKMLSHDFFMRNTKEFYQFYLKHMIHQDVVPNQAHEALAELERRGKLKAVITQNIDGLHQLAGSKKVLELHGSVHRNYCMSCDRFYELDYMLNFKDEVPQCDQCGGIVKPDVVLYQEALNERILEESIKYISEAEVCIVGGTSLRVYPAAGLIRHYQGNNLILINKTPTQLDGVANYIIHDSIGKVMKEIIDG